MPYVNFLLMCIVISELSSIVGFIGNEEHPKREKKRKRGEKERERKHNPRSMFVVLAGQLTSDETPPWSGHDTPNRWCTDAFFSCWLGNGTTSTDVCGVMLMIKLLRVWLLVRPGECAVLKNGCVHRDHVSWGSARTAVPAQKGEGLC